MKGDIAYKSPSQCKDGERDARECGSEERREAMG